MILPTWFHTLTFNVQYKLRKDSAVEESGLSGCNGISNDRINQFIAIKNAQKPRSMHTTPDFSEMLQEVVPKLLT